MRKTKRSLISVMLILSIIMTSVFVPFTSASAVVNRDDYVYMTGGGGPDMTGVTPRQMVETTSTVIFISVGVGIATGNFKPLLVLVGTEVLIAIMENNEKNRQQN